MLEEKRAICTGLIPICCNCKKIRDENGNWESSDAYFVLGIDVKFTHGICTECVKRLYPTLKP